MNVNTTHQLTQLCSTLLLIAQLLIVFTVLCLVIGVYSEVNGLEHGAMLDWVRGVFHVVGIRC